MKHRNSRPEFEFYKISQSGAKNSFTNVCTTLYERGVEKNVCWPARHAKEMENKIHSTTAISLSVLTAIFPGEPGLAGFIEAKDDGSGGDNWSYKNVI